jgi:LuxR family maltose regulon positive regulatory protein
MGPGVRVTRCRLLDAEVCIVSTPVSLPARDLSTSERAVLRALLRGDSALAIARRRRRSPSTVLRQIESIYRKLGIHSRGELMALTLDGGGDG